MNKTLDARNKGDPKQDREKSLKILIYWGVKCKQAEQMSILQKYDDL